MGSKKLRDPAALLQNDRRALLLAAHPDDETIGASSALMRLHHVWVVYLTDGAPLDSKFWPAGQTSRAAYALTRRKEAEIALGIAGLPTNRIAWLRTHDQELIFHVPATVKRLGRLLSRISPDLVITHPYEGGHPDHDAAALVVSLTLQKLPAAKKSPELVEMTSYHMGHGSVQTGEFLPSAQEEIFMRLSKDETRRKKQMLAAYESQKNVLETIPIGLERFRFAPAYDFTKPPHPGKLWYEHLGWPMTGKNWCVLAKNAIAELEG